MVTSTRKDIEGFPFDPGGIQYNGLGSEAEGDYSLPMPLPRAQAGEFPFDPGGLC